MNTWDRGDLVELKGIFRNDAEVVTDPTTITFKIQPDGGATVTTYVYGTDVQLVRASAGTYTVNWIVAADGVHQYRFIGTGIVQQEQGGQFYARPRNVV